MSTETEVRAWLDAHKGHRVRPLDIVFGGVEIIEDEGLDAIVLNDDGTLDYDAAGETEIFWDSQTTIGFTCGADYQEIICDEWVAGVFGKGE